MITASWLSLMEKLEAETTEGDTLVSSKHGLSMMAGYIVSCCFYFFLKKVFLQCQMCIPFGSGV